MFPYRPAARADRETTEKNKGLRTSRPAWIIESAGEPFQTVTESSAMARRLRIEFEGATYHVMARGNARQKIVRDHADRRRLVDGLERTVSRTGWELLCYVILGNHLHLLLQTPRPNLAAGMQGLLSGYSTWFARRH